MSAQGKHARIAGLWFLVVILAAPVRLIVVPDGSAQDVLEHLALFRLGIITDLLTGMAMLMLALTLRRLLVDVDRGMANTVVILGGILPAALYTINVVNDAAAIIMATGAPYLDAFSEAQRFGLAELFLRLHDRMVLASELFWGAWLLPLSVLVWHAGFLPRLLGAWLLVNGIAYIAQCVVGFAWPAFAPTLSSLCAPIQFGEIVFAFWLLAFGARPGFRREVQHGHA